MINSSRFFLISYILCCVFIFLRLEIIFGDDVRAPFTDDFYYYLTTVKNFINLGYITFDKISLTNGFQPLWFFILLSIKFFIQNDILFNCIVISIIFFLCLITYFNFKKFLIQNNYNKDQAILISSLIAYLSLFFSKNGMEASLAIFFFSISILYLKDNIIFFSLLGFLTFLSRLEFIFFYFVIIFNEIFVNKKIFNLNYICKISVLALLIISYILINIYYFELPFPESGIAKSLTNEFKFNIETFSFLFANGLGMNFISMLFYFNFLGFLFLFSKKIRLFTKISIISVALFFLSNSLRSAWPLWTWHFLLLAISTPLILGDLIEQTFKKYVKIGIYLSSMFFVISFFYLFKDNLNAKHDHILNVAKKIENYYADSEYEVFAMGDMAGKTSYLLNKKLIQLEGLMSGKAMLDNIRNEVNLCKVLKDNNTEVYLTSKLELKNDLIYVEEPTQNSKNIKKMRGIFKVKPNQIFNSGNLNIYAFELINNDFCIN